ncbi:MAG TPA: histidine kinase [Longimicrobium sp.]|jgi:signal transduction histidine kinase
MKTHSEAAAKVKLAVAIFLAATLFGLLLAVQLYFALRARGETVAWPVVVAAQLPPWYIWACFVPIVARAGSALWLPGEWLRPAVGHVAVATALMFARAGIEAGAAYAFDPGTPGSRSSIAALPWREVFWGLLRLRMGTDLLAYGMILGVTSAVRFNLRWREREQASAQLSIELSEARLRALRGQLNPHFFYNTLNSIAMLVRRQRGPDAVELIAGLGELLRFVLDDSRPGQIPLAEELRFVQRYLEVEKIRFGERLRVTVEVSPEAQRALVPTLILQPVVENAIHHGVAKRAQVGHLAITAEVRAGRLWITVRDNGPGPDPRRGASSPGVGLRNTRERLKHHFGDDCTLELRREPGDETAAILGMPYIPAHEHSVVPA